MLHVTAVKANIKTGVNLAGLGTKVLIHGDNEGGKSAVTDAVTLALLGVVPRIAGKDRKQARDLMPLLSHEVGQVPYKGTLRSDLILSDGSEVSWSTTGSLASASDPNWDRPKTVAKMFDLASLKDVLINKGDEPRKRFFLDEAAALAFEEPDLFARIPGPYQTYWQRFRGGAAAVRDPGPVVLNRVSEGIGPALSAERAKLKSLEIAKDRLGNSVTHVPTQAELDAVHDAAERAKSALARHDVDVRLYATEKARHASKMTEAQNAIATCTTAMATAQEQGLAARAQLEGMGPVIDVAPETQRLVEALLAVATQQAKMLEAGHLRDCVLCHGTVDAERAKSIAADVRRDAEGILAAGILAASRAKVAAFLANAETAYYEAHKSLVAWQETFRAAEVLLGELEAPAALDVDALQKVADQYAALAGLTAAQTQMNQIKTDIVAAEAEITKLTGFKAEVQTLTESLLTESKAALEKSVSAFLPEGETFRLILEYEGKSLCLVGLEREGVVDIALSDSTWDRVVLAIAAALSEQYEMAVLIGEDRAYDPVNLAATMRALTKAKAQIILTSPMLPAGRTPAGWQVIPVEQVRAGALPEAEKKPKKSKDQPKTNGGGAADGHTDTSDTAADVASGEDPDAGVPVATAAVDPVADPEPTPPLAAPWWVYVRGQTRWAGPTAGAGTGGQTLDEAIAPEGGLDAAVEAWVDPRAELDQSFRRLPTGTVLRRIGRRVFVHAAPDPSWGAFLGADDRNFFPFSSLGSPTVVKQEPLGRGSSVVLSNGIRVFQTQLPSGIMWWMAFAGTSGLTTLAPVAGSES